MIKEFWDKGVRADHKNFQLWRQEHPKGVFVTFVTKTKVTLHGSECLHLGGPLLRGSSLNAGDDNFTLKRKVVADKQKELETWTTKEGLIVN